MFSSSGLVKINLSYVKGKKQNFEVLDNGINATEGLQGYKHLMYTKNVDHSELYTRWSQLTDDDNTLESDGKSRRVSFVRSFFLCINILK